MGGGHGDGGGGLINYVLFSRGKRDEYFLFLEELEESFMIRYLGLVPHFSYDHLLMAIDVWNVALHNKSCAITNLCIRKLRRVCGTVSLQI